VTRVHLADLLPVAPGLADAPDPVEADAVVVDRVDHDSRAVEPGSLFACLRGATTDGHDHAPEAVRRGAVALLCERPLGLGVPEVRVADARIALGPVAARAAGDPSHHLTVVGVTGTNGKTTTTHLVRAIFDAAGRPCTVIGTLSGARTTPEATDLQRTLASELAAGAEAAAIEISSHALELHRIDGTRVAVAGFTNLSQDHLDFHGDLESYFQAKARLFTPGIAAAAVINVDDEHGARLAATTEVPVVAVHLDDLPDLRLEASRTRFTWRGHEVDLPLAGRFNAANAVLAAELAAVCGIDEATIVGGLAGAAPIPGRFEVVGTAGPVVVVDYAHTPDGLERALATAREVTSGRVLVVFGCGGDRDRGKRPLMGEVASRLADEAIVTDDNPRHEDPDVIVAEILGGVPAGVPVRVERDRRAAIADAIGAAREHDVVLIAGKGHETTQVVGDEVRPFDDVAVARAVLAASSGGVDAS
jgi:UDP-N-acetylmuramoyl-L-alanyl-D-glutamate--2,6-diaminopimelate ligase